MKKRYKRQRTALRNNSSRELPGVNVFLSIYLGQKKDSAHQTWLDFTGRRCWALMATSPSLNRARS